MSALTLGLALHAGSYLHLAPRENFLISTGVESPLVASHPQEVTSALDKGGDLIAQDA